MILLELENITGTNTAALGVNYSYIIIWKKILI